jgi:transcriptional regulator with XRE-family HTH domain
MPNRSPVAPTYDVQLMFEDMAVRGWNKNVFSQRAGVADMTVIRFLRGERQTAPTAKKLADALGHSVTRYLISARQQASA